METSIAARLLDLNRQFYQTFGGEFSATRGRIQPGVRRVLETLRGDEIILDLGCGNGELARALARRGHRGSYTGLDFSLPLLKEAERHLEGSTAKFLQADLTSPDWENVIARGEAPTLAPAASAGEQSHVTSSPEIASSGFDTVRAASNGGTPVRDGRLSPPRNDMFDIVFCFAVLHHIPGTHLRLRLLNKVHSLLADGGGFIHSEWQFLNSPRLRERIQDWGQIGLAATDVDINDYLLDWRHGGRGLRYVHYFSEAELNDLAFASGFRAAETFYSDGEGGRLGLYQVWETQ